MSKTISGTIIYPSFCDLIRDHMPKTQQFDFLTAVIYYGVTGEEPNMRKFSKGASSIWGSIKPQVDANVERRENGKNGGRPKKEKEEKPQEEEAETTGFENENHRLENPKPKEKVKDKAKAKANDKAFAFAKEESGAIAQPDAGAGSAPDEPPAADLITADDIQKFREDQERRRLERIAEKITKGVTA